MRFRRSGRASPDLAHPAERRALSLFAVARAHPPIDGIPEIGPWTSGMVTPGPPSPRVRGARGLYAPVVPTLSLAMIACDEETILARVLGDAATFCDELVVVDTGSSDATVEVAARCGAGVEHFTWVDDFAAATSQPRATSR